jgi:DNA-binding transcriptional ArsR family regulator
MFDVRRTSPVTRGEPDVARIAAAVADRSRASMLDALLDGRPRTIGALARHAGVSAATASGHLRRLLDERLVIVTSAGRERAVELAGPEVARLLETMAVLAPPSPSFTASAGRQRAELRFARTCYDHLAGALAVRVTVALVSRGWLEPTGDAFTTNGGAVEWLGTHACGVADSSRPLLRACVDWSERVPHVAGRLGAGILQLFFAENWVARVRDSRALRLTQRGRTALARELEIHLGR